MGASLNPLPRPLRTTPAWEAEWTNGMGREGTQFSHLYSTELFKPSWECGYEAEINHWRCGCAQCVLFLFLSPN